MATPVEQQKELVSSETTLQSQEPPKYSSLASYTDAAKTSALVSCNATLPPPKVENRVALPKLTESQQSGYVRGVATPITCCTVGRHLIEKNTAYDYIMMANAAASAGITLKIIAAFRPMEIQQRLWNERMMPGGKPNAVAAKLGAAAQPGWSNHQSGIALDIDVGMTPDDYKARRWSPAFLWLKGNPDVASTRTPPYETTGNAIKFGFAHYDGAPVYEAWHWVHPEKRIYGVQSFQAITGFQVETSETAIAAANLSQTGAARVLTCEAHDLTVAVARAKSMSQTSRSTLHAENALFCANTSNLYSSSAAQFDPTSLNVMPKPFEATTLKPFSYNFETGVWEHNGEPV